MTEQEAIETIEAAKDEIEWNYTMDYYTAFDMAKEALEKQTPEKAIRDVRFMPEICPVCNDFLYHMSDADKKPNFCRNCGKRIYWEDKA